MSNSRTLSNPEKREFQIAFHHSTTCSRLQNNHFLFRYVVATPEPRREDEEIDNCFCESRDKCDIGGIMNVSKCRKGLPIVMSGPHFYLGEASLTKQAIGLNPSKEKHETFLDISSVSNATENRSTRAGLPRAGPLPALRRRFWNAGHGFRPSLSH